MCSFCKKIFNVTSFINYLIELSFSKNKEIKEKIKHKIFGNVKISTYCINFLTEIC